MRIKSRFGFTTRRPVAIIMIALGIAVFGYVSLSRLSWELMPEISYPSYTIRTEYPGAAPEEVENVVSRPLEEQLSLIKDLVSVTSMSRPEQSDIILEFNWGANLDRAAQEIREKIDQVYLDRAVERPMILRYDPSLDPVLRIGIISDIPLIELREIVQDEISRELESLEGVAAARVKGGFEKEILIKLDEKKLATTKIRFGDITNRLNQENINMAGGNIKEGETEYIVRTLNEFRSLSEIGNIIVAKREDVNVRLKDIADVSYSHKERKVITRVNKRESIEVNVYKEADANIVDVCTRVKERLLGTAEQQEFAKRLKKEKPGQKKSFKQILKEKRMTDFIAYRLPHRLEYYILADQSVFIQNSINEVRNTAFIGGILAVVILFLFLQHFSTTLIVAVSIPISLIATFAPLNIFKVSLNIMSLGGLALGIGMLVDNSIVVMESIFRCREEGDGWVDSAVRGVSEVGGAVTASTLTTIAVFFPIVFVKGIAGQIFGDLSLAVVFSLLASLMVSLFFIPMLASRKIDRKKYMEFKQFSFHFEKEKSVKNYFLVISQTVSYLLDLFLYLVVVSFIFLISVFTVLFYPVLSIIRLKNYLVQLVKYVEQKFKKKKLLWDEFMVFAPFYQYVESLSGKMQRIQSRWFPVKKQIFLIPILLWIIISSIFSYFYYVFRFFLTGFTFALTRFGISLFGMGIVFVKGAGILFLTIFGFFVIIVKIVFNKFLKLIYEGYPKLLALSLKNDLKIIGTVLVLFLITIFVILPHIGSELIPEVHQGTIYVNVTFPVGTPVEKSDSLLQNISREVSELALVDSLSYYAGTTKEELSEEEVGEHIGKLTVNIKKSRNLKKTEEMVIANIRGVLRNFTDIDYNISRPVLFSMKPPVEVVIKGYNLEQLRRISRELYEDISRLPGLKDVQSSVKPGFPELVVGFDRMKLSHYGMNAYDVATLIKNKIEGFVATKFKEKDKRIDIRVYLRDEQRQRAENIKNLIINPGGQVPIPLRSIADISILSGPNEIRRVDQDRSAIITANIADISLDDAVEKIYHVVEQYSMPPEFRYELSGQNKEMKTSLSSLTMAMILAIFLVYIVMASQFESFLHPFLILFTIPMAIIGVFFTLFVLNISLGITVYIGMIVLVGIVVNNAIVLIDYINLLRKRGTEKLEAIKQAGRVRLRPILITTFTTVLALFPMAIGMGEGTEIRTPMAVSIIAGLLSATFLTLVLIPIVYNRFSK
ncbi:MAG: efflux RND transporter permease subunit [Candidatus Aminicenantes bacterium]|nr:efflux RND transporter permease subunit [Candidatus Aminicenantes bacterium]